MKSNDTAIKPVFLLLVLSCLIGWSCTNKRQSTQPRPTPNAAVIDISEAEQEKLSAQLEELRKRLDTTTDIPLRINAVGNGRESHTLRIDLIRNTPEWQKRFREQIMDSPALRFDGPDGQEPCDLDGAAQIGDVRLVPQQEVFPTSSQEANFILYNQSEDTISYGAAYYLAYEKGGQWYYLPTDRVFDLLKISLLPNGQTIFNANLYPELMRTNREDIVFSKKWR